MINVANFYTSFFFHTSACKKKTAGEKRCRGINFRPKHFTVDSRQNVLFLQLIHSTSLAATQTSLTWAQVSLCASAGTTGGTAGIYLAGSTTTIRGSGAATHQGVGLQQLFRLYFWLPVVVIVFFIFQHIFWTSVYHNLLSFLTLVLYDCTLSSNACKQFF